jgi:sec-independent protein translocase protein TatA
MFSRLGGWEIVIILVIVLIIFGAGKLPQVGSAIGKGIRNFRKGQSGEAEESEDTEKEKITAAKRKRTAAKKSVKS